MTEISSAKADLERAKDAVASDPNRGAPPKGGQGFYIPEFDGAAGSVGGYISRAFALRARE